jgi:hypothetical protein
MGDVMVRLVVLAVTAVTIAGCSNGNVAWVAPPTSTTTPPAEAGVRVFNQEALEEGVTKILKERYNEDATDVRCPADQVVKKGKKFDCDLKIGGDRRKVTITVISEDRAEYEVSQSK